MPKKTARRKPSKRPGLARFTGNVKTLRRDAEGLLGRARKEVTRLAREQQRALDAVAGEARRLRSDFESTVKRASRDLESRSKQFLSTLQKDAEKRLEPVLKRLLGRDQTVRQEVQSLSRRVQELERRVQQHSHPAAPAPTPVAAVVERGPAPVEES